MGANLPKKFWRTLENCGLLMLDSGHMSIKDILKPELIKPGRKWYVYRMSCTECTQLCCRKLTGSGICLKVSVQILTGPRLLLC